MLLWHVSANRAHSWHPTTRNMRSASSCSNKVIGAFLIGSVLCHFGPDLAGFQLLSLVHRLRGSLEDWVPLTGLLGYLCLRMTTLRHRKSGCRTGLEGSGGFDIRRSLRQIQAHRGLTFVNKSDLSSLGTETICGTGGTVLCEREDERRRAVITGG